MRKGGVFRGKQSAGVCADGYGTGAHMGKSMNFIQIPGKMLLRFVSRNKAFSVLLAISGLAATLSLVLWRNSAHMEQDIHRDIDSLRGNIDNMASALQDLNFRFSHSSNRESRSNSKPFYWLEAKTESKLQRVVQVLERIGYQRGNSESDWSLLWSFEYLFNKYRNKFLNLKPYQKINHLPGNVVFVSKVELAASLQDTSFHPRSFVLPKDSEKFKSTVHQRPEALWVVKSATHRRIKIYKGNEVPLDLSGSFVQEFISNPLLIGGRKFDIGVYTLIAGVDPLRVYVYEEEFLLRFCSENYKPLNVSNINQYVVTDHYSPVWEAPIIGEKYAKYKLSSKESFLTHMKEHGYRKQVEEITSKMNEIIKMVLRRFEPSLVKAMKKIGDPKYFFELVRFDFILDESLKVWLMEVNMSPNLDPSHFPPNQVMFEQVIFNTLSLIGLARPGGFNYNGEFESIMLVTERDLQLPLPECYNGVCTRCDSSICSLCSYCMSPREEYILKQAFLEHLGRRNFARVIPDPIEDRSQLSEVVDSTDEELTPMNRLLTQWFRGKCLQHVTWCS